MGVFLAPSRKWWWALPIILVCASIFYNPVGFAGGGADDGRYLTAAKCWLAHGPCLPTNHWEGRWPIVLPLSISLALFDVNRLSVGLPSLVASLFCLVLLKWHGDRLFGRPVGLAAALIFGLTPILAIQALSATVEPVELLTLLGGFAAIQLRRPFVAGIILAIAFQTRETAVLALPPALFLLRQNLKGAAFLIAGFALPLLVELAFFYAETGNPLYRRTLSVQHTLVPSSELDIEERGAPFFNANLIANWRFEPGLNLHWTVNGLVNLLVNPKTALIFLITPAFYFLYRDHLNETEKRVATFLLGASLFYLVGLIYGLAVDPKPRMMFAPLAGFSLVLGLVAVRAWGPVIAATFTAVLALAVIVLAAQPRTRHWEQLADELNRRYPGQIESSQASFFELRPDLYNLPPIGSGRQFALIFKRNKCEVPSMDDRIDLRRVQLVTKFEGAWPNSAFNTLKTWQLCFFKYDEGYTPVRSAIAPESA